MPGMKTVQRAKPQNPDLIRGDAVGYIPDINTAHMNHKNQNDIYLQQMQTSGNLFQGNATAGPKVPHNPKLDPDGKDKLQNPALIRGTQVGYIPTINPGHVQKKNQPPAKKIGYLYGKSSLFPEDNAMPQPARAPPPAAHTFQHSVSANGTISMSAGPGQMSGPVRNTSNISMTKMGAPSFAAPMGVGPTATTRAYPGMPAHDMPMMPPQNQRFAENLSDDSDLQSDEVDEASVSYVYKEKIRELYEKQNPEKLKRLDTLMAKYEGSEHSLYVKICQKYNLTPDEEYKYPTSFADEEAKKAPKPVSKPFTAAPTKSEDKPVVPSFGAKVAETPANAPLFAMPAEELAPAGPAPASIAMNSEEVAPAGPAPASIAMNSEEVAPAGPAPAPLFSANAEESKPAPLFSAQTDEAKPAAPSFGGFNFTKKEDATGGSSNISFGSSSAPESKPASAFSFTPFKSESAAGPTAGSGLFNFGSKKEESDAPAAPASIASAPAPAPAAVSLANDPIAALMAKIDKQKNSAEPEEDNEDNTPLNPTQPLFRMPKEPTPEPEPEPEQDYEPSGPAPPKAAPGPDPEALRLQQELEREKEELRRQKEELARQKEEMRLKKIADEKKALQRQKEELARQKEQLRKQRAEAKKMEQLRKAEELLRKEEEEEKKQREKLRKKAAALKERAKIKPAATTKASIIIPKDPPKPSPKVAELLKRIKALEDAEANFFKLRKENLELKREIEEKDVYQKQIQKKVDTLEELIRERMERERAEEEERMGRDRGFDRRDDRFYDGHRGDFDRRRSPPRRSPPRDFHRRDPGYRDAGYDDGRQYGRRGDPFGDRNSGYGSRRRAY